jgi:hypothetical protein
MKGSRNCILFGFILTMPSLGSLLRFSYRHYVSWVLQQRTTCPICSAISYTKYPRRTLTDHQHIYRHVLKTPRNVLQARDAAIGDASGERNHPAGEIPQHRIYQLDALVAGLRVYVEPAVYSTRYTLE